MIKSFFTVAIRFLLKKRSYALLNIFGLSVGLACATLIALWAKDELSFDRFHVHAERIYRVAGTFTDESGTFDQAVTPIPLAPALISDLPEVEDAVRLGHRNAIVRHDDQQFVEDHILPADPSFFRMFDFRLLEGNTATSLRDPYSVVLSESMAKKYFGDRDPLGESLRLYLYDPGEQGAEYKVTGVIEDCPANSHFRYNFLISFKTVEAARPQLFGHDGWFENGYYTYIYLKPHADVRQLKKKMSTFLEKYIGPEMKKSKISWTYFLQPLTDIHLHSRLRYEIGPTNSVSSVAAFSAIGMMVLLLACINYVNLSTAYSGDRFREVGVRKVMGAHKNQLIGQYLAESWLLGMLSMIVAIAWIELTRPLFESLTGKAIAHLYDVNTIVPLFLAASCIGLMAGLYPAIVLSSFKTVNVLKGHFRSGSGGLWLRKGLMVFQYAVTMALITGILVVQLQLRFIRGKDLGFDRDNLLILNVNGSHEVLTGYDAFVNDLLSHPSVSHAARSNSMISGGLANSVATITDAVGKSVNGTVFTLRVDPEYIDTYGMTLLAGRNFVKGSLADSLNVIVNEETTRAYGYRNPEDAIGKALQLGDAKGEIIGVVKDFHYSSLQQKIAPTCMYLLREGFSRIAVRLHSTDDATLVADAWKKHFPDTVPEYAFAETRLNDQYHAEQRFSKLFAAFSAISLTIACLGLFALVSYSVEARTKEIGIRKVLGATVLNIVNLLSGEFLVLIVCSCLIAIPVAYYFMSRWLEGFAYHITMNASVFAVAGIASLLIAALTIGLRSVRSALNNPVDSLRNE